MKMSCGVFAAGNRRSSWLVTCCLIMSENVRFFVHTLSTLDYKAVDIHSMLTQAHGDIISLRQVQRISKEFRDGDRIGYASEPKAGRPRSVSRHENIEPVKNLLQNDPTLSCAAMATMLDVPHSTVHRILTEDLNLISVHSRFVPHALTDVNKQNRVTCAKEIIKALRTRNIKSRLIVTDEKWVYSAPLGTAATRRSWIQPDGDRPAMTRRSISSRKHMILVAVCMDGKHYMEVLGHGETVNAARYVVLLQ